MKGGHVVFLGGTDTYGKFIEMPYPALLEQDTGITCVNLGWPNAGVDVYLNEPMVCEAARRARAVVLQLPCAQNMSNRFYAVHPRRNDRFVAPSAQMRSLFRDIDFTEFHFTRHLLGHLLAVAPDRFGLIRDELQTAWVARMRLLLDKLGPRVILLWLAARHPGEDNDSPDLAVDPAFVTRTMIDRVRERAVCLVEVCASPAARAAGTAGMVFSEVEASAASELLNPMAHQEAARALGPAIAKVIE